MGKGNLASAFMEIVVFSKALVGRKDGGWDSCNAFLPVFTQHIAGLSPAAYSSALAFALRRRHLVSAMD